MKNKKAFAIIEEVTKSRFPAVNRSGDTGKDRVHEEIRQGCLRGAVHP